jgi:hypothetical protein
MRPSEGRGSAERAWVPLSVKTVQKGWSSDAVDSEPRSEARALESTSDRDPDCEGPHYKVTERERHYSKKGPAPEGLTGLSPLTRHGAGRKGHGSTPVECHFQHQPTFTQRCTQATGAGSLSTRKSRSTRRRTRKESGHE